MTTAPAAVDYGCPWPVDSACFEDEFDDLDEDVQKRSVAFASATLRRLTGYRVGGCPVTVRPCKQGCVDAGVVWQWGPATGFTPVNWAGTWINSCGCAQVGCSCGPICEIALPPPVGRIDRIMIDGTDMGLEDFQVHDGNKLTFVGDGDCPFPACQNMVLPDTEVGTFSVTYLNSYQVDEMGAYAAGVLALEFAKACVPGKKCRLPANVTTLTRQGVSMEIAAGTFPNGTTGIREVDSFIGLWNPKGLTRGFVGWFPGQDTARVVG